MYRSYNKSVDIDVNNQKYNVNISTPISKNINLDISKTVGGGDKFFFISSKCTLKCLGDKAQSK